MFQTPLSCDSLELFINKYSQVNKMLFNCMLFKNGVMLLHTGLAEKVYLATVGSKLGPFGRYSSTLCQLIARSGWFTTRSRPVEIWQRQSSRSVGLRQKLESGGLVIYTILLQNC